MEQLTEQDLITFINNYLATCKGEPAILNAIKLEFGHLYKKPFKFTRLGFGKLHDWLDKNRDKLAIDQAKARATVIGLRTNVKEEEMLLFVTSYIKQKGFKGVLKVIREKYGSGEFSRFGFGSFNEFVERYDLESLK
jgi:hypothetical protein